jgi:two-component system NtrC family sensor kinase
MHVFVYIAAFLLLRRIIKTVKFTPLRFKWTSKLNAASGILWVVYIVVNKLPDSV